MTRQRAPRAHAPAPAGAVAHAAYLDASHTPSFFGKLRVATSAEHADEDQAFAAGFLEGYLTAARIADHHSNLKTYFTQTLNVTLKKPMEWWVGCLLGLGGVGGGGG
jgi:hypothetical protein